MGNIFFSIFSLSKHYAVMLHIPTLIAFCFKVQGFEKGSTGFVYLWFTKKIGSWPQTAMVYVQVKHGPEVIVK